MLAQVEQWPMALALLGVPCIAADVVFKDAPCALEDHIETKPAVFHPNLAESVAFIDGVELVPLLRAAHDVASYPELIERWAGVVPHDRAIRICAWALRNGILASGGEAVGSGMAERLPACA